VSVVEGEGARSSARAFEGALKRRRISVVVPTRGRAEQIQGCVAAILACRGLVELIVVDQSTDNGTRAVLDPHFADARLRYVQSQTRGVSAARNEGIALAGAPLIAFTDDDCRVPSDWLERIEAVFAEQPDAAVLCGAVRVPDDLARRGFAAQFAPKRRVYRSFPPPGEWGISANMTVRREVFVRLGTFDPLLGAGAPLRSGAEFDLLVRVWEAGLTVVNASEVEVIHTGVRARGGEARALFRGDGIGIGATFSKYARLRGPGSAGLYARWLAHLMLSNLRKLFTFTRPIGLIFTLAFVYGSVLSFNYEIDRKSRMYVARSSARGAIAQADPGAAAASSKPADGREGPRIEH
jgi:glycosyltransferase involved in cell wall biosynthesis